MNIADQLKRWGEHMLILRGMSRKSVAAYTQYLLEFINWYESFAGPGQGRKIVFKKVTRPDIERYMEHLFYNVGNSNSTRKTKLITIRSFWRWLQYEGFVEEDVTYGIPTPIVRIKLIQSFTRREILRIFRQVDIYSAKGMRDNALLILLAFAGLRVGELCGLRIGDLADDGEYINVHIPEDLGKKGSSRVVELWKAPSVFVRQWVAMRVSTGATTGSAVFVSFRRGDKPTGRPLVPRSVDRIVKTHAEAAQVRKPAVTSHMFRATHASDLRAIKGYDIAAIAERLGHRNISTTDRYLPQRGRLKKEYRSLREYWREWEQIWTGVPDGSAE